MKGCFLVLAIMLMPGQFPAQSSVGIASRVGRTSFAPVALNVSGPGKVLPYNDGDELIVGVQYAMGAIPNPGCVFKGWQRANKFTFTEYVSDSTGVTRTNVTVTYSPVAGVNTHLRLQFTVEPPVVIYDAPGVRTVTEQPAWQANFEPRSR